MCSRHATTRHHTPPQSHPATAARRGRRPWHHRAVPRQQQRHHDSRVWLHGDVPARRARHPGGGHQVHALPGVAVRCVRCASSVLLAHSIPRCEHTLALQARARCLYARTRRRRRGRRLTRRARRSACWRCVAVYSWVRVWEAHTALQTHTHTHTPVLQAELEKARAVAEDLQQQLQAWSAGGGWYHLRCHV